MLKKLFDNYNLYKMNKNIFSSISPDGKIFVVNNLCEIVSCNEFYQFFIKKLKKANKVYLACLALDNDIKTQKIIKILKYRIDNNKKTLLMCDKTRNEKPYIIKMLTNNNLINNIIFKDLRTFNWLPCFINEVLSVFHTKLYILDDEIILSGANLCKSYFENRVDRYFVIKDVNLANYLGEKVFEKKLYLKQYITSVQRFSCSKLIKNTNIQIFTYNQSEEKNILLQLFNTDFVKLYISSAYVNFPNSILNSLKNKQFTLFGPAPENNTFNSFGFCNQIITRLYGYSHYYTLYVLNKKYIYEFIKPDHSFHKKGIWLFYETAAINIIGSSNYNRRSNTRDIEQNMVLFTTDQKIIALWKNEIDNIKNNCKKRFINELVNRQNLFIIILFYILNFLL